MKLLYGIDSNEILQKCSKFRKHALDWGICGGVMFTFPNHNLQFLNTCIESSMWALSPSELPTTVWMDPDLECEHDSCKCCKCLIASGCVCKQKFNYVSHINESSDKGNQNIQPFIPVFCLKKKSNLNMFRSLFFLCQS